MKFTILNKIKPKVDFQEKKIIEPREIPEKIQIDTQKKISTGSGFIINNGKHYKISKLQGFFLFLFKRAQ